MHSFSKQFHMIVPTLKFFLKLPEYLPASLSKSDKQHSLKNNIFPRSKTSLVFESQVLGYPKTIYLHTHTHTHTYVYSFI